jgi:hypothetical protein
VSAALPRRSELDAALRKAASVWVQPDGYPSRLVWALWPSRGPLSGSLLVATGGTEQEVPGLVDGAVVTVVVARPGTRSRLTTVTTTATVVEPDETTMAALAAARRNAPPGWTTVLALALPCG